MFLVFYIFFCKFFLHTLSVVYVDFRMITKYGPVKATPFFFLTRHKKHSYIRFSIQMDSGTEYTSIFCIIIIYKFPHMEASHNPYADNLLIAPVLCLDWLPQYYITYSRFFSDFLSSYFILFLFTLTALPYCFSSSLNWHYEVCF